MYKVAVCSLHSCRHVLLTIHILPRPCGFTQLLISTHWGECTLIATYICMLQLASPSGPVPFFTSLVWSPTLLWYFQMRDQLSLAKTSTAHHSVVHSKVWCPIKWANWTQLRFELHNTWLFTVKSDALATVLTRPSLDSNHPSHHAQQPCTAWSDDVLPTELTKPNHDSNHPSVGCAQ